MTSMIFQINAKLLKIIRDILAQKHSAVFAYLYGSCTDTDIYNDIDIAVYSATDCEFLQ